MRYRFLDAWTWRVVHKRQDDKIVNIRLKVSADRLAFLDECAHHFGTNRHEMFNMLVDDAESVFRNRMARHKREQVDDQSRTKKEAGPSKKKSIK